MLIANLPFPSVVPCSAAVSGVPHFTSDRV